jgi:hypothetical protein
MQNDQPPITPQPNPENFQPAPAPTGPLPQPPRPTNADPDAAAKHAESVRRHPTLNLSSDEYIIAEVRRTRLGLVSIWAFVALMVLLVVGLLPIYAVNRPSFESFFAFPLPTAATLSVPLLIAAALLILGGYIAMQVYNSNILYLTNESIILHVRASLFNTKLRLIGLVNIQDASAGKVGIIQQLFNFGTVELSTKGEDIEFPYASNPQHLADIINDAIEAARKTLEREEEDPRL